VKPVSLPTATSPQSYHRPPGYTHSQAEATLALQWTAARLAPYVREYQFDPNRKFRFDFAVPQIKFAVEIEGGIWRKGAHSSPQGILRDMQKGNLAVLAGWAVLRFSAAQVRTGEAVAMIRDYLARGASTRVTEIAPGA
jgi:very-short-patch-repair endonuclease